MKWKDTGDKLVPVWDESPSSTYVAILYKYDKNGKLEIIPNEFKYEIKYADLEHNNSDWAFAHYMANLYPFTEYDRMMGCIVKDVVSKEQFELGLALKKAEQILAQNGVTLEENRKEKESTRKSK